MDIQIALTLLWSLSTGVVGGHVKEGNQRPPPMGFLLVVLLTSIIHDQRRHRSVPVCQ
jgi:hypothetical protein